MRYEIRKHESEDDLTGQMVLDLNQDQYLPEPDLTRLWFRAMIVGSNWDDHEMAVPAWMLAAICDELIARRWAQEDAETEARDFAQRAMRQVLGEGPDFGSTPPTE